MAEETAHAETKEDFADPKLVNMWLAEIKAYETSYKSWTEQCKAIVRRYRNEPPEGTTSSDISAPEFNVLWSNVETLKPIVYSRTPKVAISRKWKDKNPIGRAAAVILERATQSELDSGGFNAAMKGVRDDYLLTGRGQMWIRYVPTYGEEQRDKIFLQADTTEDGRKVYRKPDSDEPVEFGEGEEPKYTDDGLPYIEGGEPYRPVVSECVKQEHIPWDRFGHTPAPSWAKVRGVWKAEPMTRAQLVKRFGKEKGEAVKLTLRVPGVSDTALENYGDVFKRALVYEVCDATSGKWLWIADGYDDFLDVKDDPLHLKGFFPCPCPLFATTTTDSLIPVPDYRQYKTQAEKVDELEIRISLLIEAVRVAGVYAGEQNKEIEALVSRKGENKLIPVDNWAMFAEKGGLRGVIDWLPIEQVVAAISALIEAQNALLEKIYQITGLSDIVRGQETDGQPRTAAEQRIKGQYAGLRVSDRQLSTETHARDAVQITAEIIAEHFSPETLWEISGWEFSDEAQALDAAYAEWETAAREAQAAYEQAVTEFQASASGISGADPMATGGDGEAAPAPQPPVPPEIPPAPPTSRQVFDQAIELLRSERARGFTIEIETDSMVLEDQQQEAQNRTDLLEKATGFLAQAVPAAQEFPALGRMLGVLLLWAIRGHKTGRDIEQEIEQSWEGLIGAEPAAAGEDAAAQAAAEIEGAKVQVAQAKVETDKAKAEADAQLKAQKLASDDAKTQAEMQLEAMRIEAERMKAERDAASERARIVAEQATAKFDRLVAMLELKIKEREISAAESKNAVDAVIGAAQVDAQADAAQRAEETKRMARPAE